MCGCDVNRQRFVVFERSLGGTPSDPLLSQSRLPKNSDDHSIHDERPLMMRRKLESRNFGHGGPGSVVPDCVNFCILHPLVVIGFLPHLHESIVASRY